MRYDTFRQRPGLPAVQQRAFAGYGPQLKIGKAEPLPVLGAELSSPRPEAAHCPRRKSAILPEGPNYVNQLPLSVAIQERASPPTTCKIR